MAATLKPYLNAVRHTLTAAMCLDNFSSQVNRKQDFFRLPVTKRVVRSGILIRKILHQFLSLNASVEVLSGTQTLK